MSIEKLIADSDFLIAHGKCESALALLLVAIGASSKKLFPSGTKSIDHLVDPIKFDRKEMGDRERYTRFLGSRIQKIMFGDEFSEQTSYSMLGSKDERVEEFLYKQYRNSLIHEGVIPAHVRFKAPTAETVGVSVSTGPDGIEVDDGLLGLLREAVVGSPVNGKIFGRRHFIMILTGANTDDEFIKNIFASIPISFGKFYIAKLALLKIGQVVNEMSDQEIANKFFELVRQGFNIIGLCHNVYPVSKGDENWLEEGPELCSRDGNLTEKGKLLFRKIVDGHQFIDIAS